ncbi:hypothetical protein RFI_16340 [Reticulomyxa filosa]|uniref:Uncharacterized protein n=1 Tax=Reticulomyxa filosa TaxID=46433 RepID=X6N4G2_RETFI|nr:hypothetical protein RFI_16340 [Reticulomyxa filosa]|eukprot:ETO20871.1 hypothetical protein RFI_16340 [Reticulomyxa filosa]
MQMEQKYHSSAFLVCVGLNTKKQKKKKYTLSFCFLVAFGKFFFECSFVYSFMENPGEMDRSIQAIHVYDLEKNATESFELEKFQRIEDYFWDENDSRLLTVSCASVETDPAQCNGSSLENETYTQYLSELSALSPLSTKTEQSTHKHNRKRPCDHQIISFFVSPNGSLLKQEVVLCTEPYVGVNIPDYYFLNTLSFPN